MKWYIRLASSGCVVVASTLFPADWVYALPPVVMSQSPIIDENDAQEASAELSSDEDELSSDEDSELVSTEVSYQSASMVTNDQSAPAADPAFAKKTAAAKKKAALLPVTTFWIFVREFPRERLNWGPVRTVSPGQAPQTDVCSAEIAFWQQFAQRRIQLSRGKSGI